MSWLLQKWCDSNVLAMNLFLFSINPWLPFSGQNSKRTSRMHVLTNGLSQDSWNISFIPIILSFLKGIYGDWISQLECSDFAEAVKNIWMEFQRTTATQFPWWTCALCWLFHNIANNCLQLNPARKILTYKNCTLLCRHNGRNSISNHQPHDCLLNRLFKRRSKKTSQLRVTGLCAGNSPVTGEFPAQMASNTENVSILRRLHVYISFQTAYVSIKLPIQRHTIRLKWDSTWFKPLIQDNRNNRPVNVICQECSFPVGSIPCQQTLARTDGSISTGERQRAVWIAFIEISCMIIEMHKNLWRCPGSVWFLNCAYSKCIFLVRKVCRTNFRGMVSILRVEMNHIQLEIQSLLL